MITWIALFIAIYGLAEIFMHTLIGRTGFYTEESAERFAPIEGILLIVCAMALFVISISGKGKPWPEAARIAGLVTLLSGAVLELFLGQKMLVKRPDGRL